MAEKTEVPDISMRNTKKEMLTAYEEMKAIIKQKGKDVLDIEKTKEEFRKKAAAIAAEKAEKEDPVRRIHDLRGDIGHDLTALAGKFETETEEYVRVKEAVAEKQDELERIYGVETAAADLAALIEANRQMKADFKEEMQQQKEAFEQEIAETKAAWEREKADHEQQAGDQAEAQERQRKREEDEYDYKLNREREQRRNELEDEMTALGKEIAAKREEFDAETKIKEAELTKREEELVQREQHMDKLQGQVDEFPEELKSEVSDAVTAATERLQAEFAARKTLLEKGFDGDCKVLQSKIDALQKLTAAQKKQVDVLMEQQEKAYAQVQDIATKAVAGARTTVVPVQGPQQSGDSSKTRGGGD